MSDYTTPTHCVMCGDPVSLCCCERDLYTIARYISMPGDRVMPFLKVLEMCGYELRKVSPFAASHESKEKP